MKRNFVFALSICLCGLSLVAQPRSASEPQKLIETSVGLMAPVWSPDGSKIAVTTDNYTGILVANIIAKTKCAVFKNEMCKNFNFSQHQTM